MSDKSNTFRNPPDLTAPAFPPVTTKTNWLRRYKLGEFGNRGPLWDTPQEFEESEYGGLVHLRARIASAPSFYDVPAVLALERWQQLEVGDYFCAAMAPTAQTVIQGEVCRSELGLYFYYSTVAKPMRIALAERSDQAYGIIASCLLKSHLCTRSYEWLEYLLDSYPDHTIELSTYSVNWGTVPGLNTIFWEVRKY